MPKRVNYDIPRSQAHDLFMRGLSYRDIAEQVLPQSSGGYVTVAKWAKEAGWRQERDAMLREARQADTQRFQEEIASIKDRQLRVANKAMIACEMALEEYFVHDGLKVVGIKLNPKTNNPVIGPIALAALLKTASELQDRALGVQDGLSQAQAQQVVRVSETKVVDADLPPAHLRQLGDFLASLPAPSEETEQRPPQ